jgi:hypothetical protein
MPYALFSDAAKASPSFPTKSEVWRHAEQTGLVIEVRSREEDPPRRILDMGYEIRECEPEQRDMAVSGARPPNLPTRSPARVNPRSAAAAW